VIVNNKPGGGGSIAAADVIKSPPDGYRILPLASNYFGATVKTQKIPFDPNDLVPIANFMEYKIGLAVKGDSPRKTFGDLLDYAKKNPGKLTWSHTSRGSPLFMSTVLIFRKAGVKTIDVPYLGSPEALAALLGGHLDAATLSYGGIKDHVKAGSVRYLVSYSDRRYSEPPNVPCAVELGFPEAAKLRSFVSLYAHRNTPEEIKKTLFNAFK
jgi:tripartite-type tricarboxylate transporter receptor subunit TctC